MSAVSEEDVLAELLAWWFIVYGEPSLAYEPETRGLPPPGVEEIRSERLRLAGWPEAQTRGEEEAAAFRAIADSERRLEVEQAERAVLDAALAWDIEDTCDTRSHLLRAARWYRAALVLAAFP